MRSSWRELHRWAIAALVCVPTLSARAQFLDLDQPTPPVLDEPALRDVQGDRLEKQIAHLGRSGETGPRTDAQIALRTLARNLLLTPDDGPPSGRLWGLTLAREIDELDAMILNPALPESICVFLTLDLDVPRLDLPREPGELDRFLRDALAELSVHVPPPSGAWGWIPRDAPEPDKQVFAQSLDSWVREGTIRDDRAQHLRAQLARADAFPTFAIAAGTLRSRILSASSALDHADMLDPGVHERLRSSFAGALSDTMVPELRAPALDRLAALAVVGRVLGLAGRAGRDGVVQAAARWAGALDPSIIPDADLAITALGLLLEREAMPSEETLVRPLRPAWRALFINARTSEDLLAQIVPRILSSPSASSDPALLTPIAMHRRALDDLRIITRLNTLLIDGVSRSREPAVREDRRKLTQRLLRLGQALSKDSQRDSALQTLRFLGEQADVVARLAPLQGAADVLGHDAAQGYARAVDSSVSAWVDALSEAHDEQARTQTARNALLADLADHARDLAVLEVRDLAIDAWPGFALSADDLAILLQRASQQLEQTAVVLIDGDTDRARKRLLSYAQEHRVLTLLARIDRALRSRGLVPGAGARVLALAAGSPPPGAYLLRRRSDLGELSLLLAELNPARMRNDPRAERDIRLYANFLAEKLLDSIDDLPRP